MIIKVNGLSYDEIHNRISNSNNVLDTIKNNIENIPFDFNGNCNLVRGSVLEELENVSNLFELNVLRTSAKVFEMVSDNVINFIDFALQFLINFL